MKINKIQNQYLDTNGYKAKEDKQKNINITKEKAVNIEISSSAKELVNKINQIDDKKYSEKVEKIRLSIQQGTYKVSNEDIADKILKTIESQKGSGNSDL
ncbi:flagellar biosynthesis protein FlgM [Alkalibaculum sp. M08DMB]|uniref:Flagellar biosynthesis protein FlgM n=1 Tax=Alkalibaculum sporogenes TaxID=2655001 RepID=A0A6A7K5V7_9FIRM|nr:flagellar biosynthesis anti-sigma factor FlgM [Alkalibaculum sporogenes]MPW24765.1 flagellar biosynthesis protein FlgM [Alkalibaculum sporogenes]